MHYCMHYCAVGRALPCSSRRRQRAESRPCPAPSRRRITRGSVGGSLYGAECGARVRSSTDQNHKRATRRATAVAITPRRLGRRGAPRRVVLVSGRGLHAGRAGGGRGACPPHPPAVSLAVSRSYDTVTGAGRLCSIQEQEALFYPGCSLSKRSTVA